jgi:type IV secretory pathway TraG/TraD family ATPase VirD4
MKLKELFWATGLWAYVIVEGVIQLSNYYGYQYFDLYIPQQYLICPPLLLIPYISYMSYKRKRDGHENFGFRDVVGLDITDEEHSKAKRQAMYPPIPKSLISKTPESLVFGKNNKGEYIRYMLGSDGVNIFTIGTPGSGKSVMIQNVLRANFLNFEKRGNSSGEKPFNFALIDIKGEHAEKLLNIKLKEYKANPATDRVYVVQPSNRNSFGWDVFYAIRKPGVTDTEILKAVTDIADALVCKGGDNPYFEVNGKKIMTGLLFFYIKEGVDFIPAIQKMLRSSFGDLIKNVVEEAEAKGYSIVLDKLKGFVGRDDNESIQDVEATMKTYLDVFSYPDVVFSLFNNNLRTSPEVLSDGITCLDLAIEESMLETYQPLFRLIAIQILKYCEASFKESDMRRTIIIIDEAARCGKITGLENALATLRSRHTSIWMLYQDLSQFRDIYGNAKADTLLNLCEIKMFLSGSGDKPTSDYVSNMAGEYEMENISYSRSGLLNAPKDPKYSKGKRPIVTSKDLLELRGTGEMIAIIYGKYYRFRKLFYFKDAFLNDQAFHSDQRR